MKAMLYRLPACVVFASIVGGLSLATQPILAAEDPRLPEPPQEKVEQSLTLIRDAYEADYHAAKESGEPEQLIAQLTTLAEQEADSVRKYALLVEAENVASAHGNYKKAVELLDARAELFRVDGLALKGELLKRLAGPKASADLELCDQAMDTARQAMRSERFEVASDAVSLALGIAKAIDREQKAAARKQRKKEGGNAIAPPSIGADLVKKAAALQAQVTATEELFEQYGDAVEKAKKSPDSPSANAVIGGYLCFVREDWKAGLPALVKSDLAEFSSLATDEMKLMGGPVPIDAQKGFELAGKWWSAADGKGVSDEHESVIKDHAAGLYAEVADRLTGSLEKRLAKSRFRGCTLKPSMKVNAVYLSDLPEREAKVVHFGFGKGTIRGEKNPIRCIIDGKESPHGLSMHPGDGPDGDCFVKYTLPNGNWRFSATTTLDQGGSFKHCGIGFEVIADGTSVWKSKTIDKHNRFEECDVAIGDCRSLELRTYTVTAAFGGHAVWIEPRITPAAEESQPPQAGLGGQWLEGLEVNRLQTRYWRVVSAGVQGNGTLNVYNDDEGRGRCPAFLGKNGNYSGEFWDLREPGLMSNFFLGPSRVLIADASGEVFMGSRQQQQDVFWTTRNPDGKSFKIRTRGGYLSAEETLEGRDIRVFVSTKDLGNRSNWFFVPTDRVIVHSDLNRP